MTKFNKVHPLRTKFIVGPFPYTIYNRVYSVVIIDPRTISYKIDTSTKDDLTNESKLYVLFHIIFRSLRRICPF